ncbi:MAG: methyltransferase domain-containing protein [Candidatus Omnitrophica bacterium]|nr:methyltransferase domain-containing protein [Candidatus Omnitrophota bacterium]MDD5429419.1 methyltransferase domain-containing protein [Candidatus Omnitrophota bacterium]
MPCLVCGSENLKETYSSLLRCSSCGFVWADLDLNQEEISKVYDDSYFFSGEYSNYVKERRALEKNFKRNIKVISRYMPSGQLLEVGSAYGFFLNLAKKQYNAQGVEINQNACKYARERLGLDVICGDFLSTNFKANYYDLVVMWATLEHLKNPHLYIEKISSLLKKNGIFACSTIDINSILARIQKDKWRQIHPPSHLSYFSQSSLIMLLAKYGLKKIHLFRLGEYRSVDNILYTILTLNNKFHRLYSLIRKLHLNRGAVYLNTYDTIYMVASKS